MPLTKSWKITHTSHPSYRRLLSWLAIGVLFGLGLGGEVAVADSKGKVAIAGARPSSMLVFGSQQSKTDLIDGVDGAEALRVDVDRTGGTNWAVLHHSPRNTVAIKKGDLLVSVLRLRVTGERTDVGDVGVYAESAVPEKSGSVGGRIQPTTKVQTFRRSVESPGDFEPGEFRMSVHLAAKAQVVELYQVSLEVFPAGTPVAQLRLTEIDWVGRDPDARWRAKAAARIDKHRKADLTIEVVDPDGNPVPNGRVKLKQKRHAWRWGTFLGGQMLEDTEDGRRYREAVKKRFNFVTLPAYLADWGWRNADHRRSYFQLADWAKQNHIPARGHLLVYPGWAATPPDWFTIPKDELREKMAAHIPRATRVFLDRGVTEWDVTNELRFNEQFMEEIGGVAVAADWFKLARKHNPKGDLYLNETFVISNGGHTETEQATLEHQFKILADAGAPIDGIGLQGHFASELTPPARVIEILSRMSELTGKIMITEFDMDNDDKLAQADYLRDFYTACFSHPAVEGIVCWGFWEGDMWRPRGHFLTEDWTATPVAKAFDDLVFGKWWSQSEGATDSEGRYQTRLFKGDHDVVVEHGDYRYDSVVTVTDDQSIRVIVP